jgi:hypothetical protein
MLACKNSILVISCECDREEEHGLQLVFKDGATLTRASGHDTAQNNASTSSNTAFPVLWF